MIPGVVSSLIALVVGLALGFGGAFLFLYRLASHRLLESQSGKIVTSLRSSHLRLMWATLASITAAYVGLLFHLDKSAAFLLFTLAVLVISNLAGTMCGLASAGISAVLLAVLFLPPAGLRVDAPEDRLALLLFLILASVGSALVGWRKGEPAN